MAEGRVSKRDELRLSESWRKRVGVALRDARTNAGLTQPKLAERAGIDWTTISQIENGASAPDLATMEAISDALNVSLDTATGRMSIERRESLRHFFDEATPPAASDAIAEQIRSVIADFEEAQEVEPASDRQVDRLRLLEARIDASARAIQSILEIMLASAESQGSMASTNAPPPAGGTT